jgi:hypothetical protein
MDGLEDPKSEDYISGAQRAPHPYALAEGAFKQMTMKADDSVPQNQSVVISGESGAGKTVSAKIVLQHLMTRVGASTGLDKRILDSNPISESLGNSKTLRNNNSSRFGKFMKLQFSSDGKFSLEGGAIETYLLEKSRVVSQITQERNFHIFYSVLASPQATALGLTKPEDYSYLNKSGCYVSPGIDDCGWFAEFTASLASMNVSAPQQSTLFALIAAVLQLGEVDFNEVDGAEGDYADVKDAAALATAAKSLAVDDAKLQAVLVEREVVTMGETIVVKLNVTAATYVRDSIAKDIYSRIFDGLVGTINQSLGQGAETLPFIGVLDIFGFESFEHNDFEQLLINYANEVLQATFNEQVFIGETKLYKDEGIEVEPVSFPDNRQCVELVSEKPHGILALLDAEAKTTKPSDLKFNAELHKLHQYNPFCPKPHAKVVREKFNVRHFAGVVTYTVGSFISKNNNSLPAHLTKMLAESRLQPSAGGGDLPGGFGTIEVPADTGGRKSKMASVSSVFLKQMIQLVGVLSATRCSFIKCIKPNAPMKASLFDHSYVLKQLACQGVLQTCEVLKVGLPTRTKYEQIAADFRPKLPADIQEAFANSNDQTLVRAILWAFEVPSADYKCGFTRVFFRTGKMAMLERVLDIDWAGDKDGMPITQWVGKRLGNFLVRQRWRTAYAKVTMALYAVKYWTGLQTEAKARKQKASVLMQRVARAAQAKRLYKAMYEAEQKRMAEEEEQRRKEAEEAKRLAAEAEAARKAAEEAARKAAEEAERLRKAEEEAKAAAAADAAKQAALDAAIKEREEAEAAQKAADEAQAAADKAAVDAAAADAAAAQQQEAARLEQEAATLLNAEKERREAERQAVRQAEAEERRQLKATQASLADTELESYRQKFLEAVHASNLNVDEGTGDEAAVEADNAWDEPPAGSMQAMLDEAYEQLCVRGSEKGFTAGDDENDFRAKALEQAEQKVMEKQQEALMRNRKRSTMAQRGSVAMFGQEAARREEAKQARMAAENARTKPQSEKAARLMLVNELLQKGDISAEEASSYNDLIFEAEPRDGMPFPDLPGLGADDSALDGSSGAGEGKFESMRIVVAAEATKQGMSLGLELGIIEGVVMVLKLQKNADGQILRAESAGVKVSDQLVEINDCVLVADESCVVKMRQQVELSKASLAPLRLKVLRGVPAGVPKDQANEDLLAQMAKNTFAEYCVSGPDEKTGAIVESLSQQNMLSLCTDALLLCERLKYSDAQMIFTQVVLSKRKTIDFPRFIDALRKIAVKRQMPFYDLIVMTDAALASNAKNASAVGWLNKKAVQDKHGGIGKKIGTFLKSSETDRRFFVLRNHELHYFADKGDLVPKGTCAINSQTTIEQGEEGPHELVVTTTGKTLHVSADTEAEGLMWANVLRQDVESLQKQRSGMLCKRATSGADNWTNRWFVLGHSSLMYYDTVEMRDCKGIITLTADTKVELHAKPDGKADPARPHCFVLVTPELNLYLDGMPDSDQAGEAESWQTDIEKAVTKLQAAYKQGEEYERLFPGGDIGLGVVGLEVHEVQAGSEGQRLGVTQGSMVLSVNGKQPSNDEDLVSLIRSGRATGMPISIRFRRNQAGAAPAQKAAAKGGPSMAPGSTVGIAQMRCIGSLPGGHACHALHNTSYGNTCRSCGTELFKLRGGSGDEDDEGGAEDAAALEAIEEAEGGGVGEEVAEADGKRLSMVAATSGYLRKAPVQALTGSGGGAPSGSHKWQKRFFRLKPGFITYHANATEPKTKGVIHLDENTLVAQTKAYPKVSSCFEVRTKAKLLTLTAADDEEMQVWIEAIKAAATATPAEKAADDKLKRISFMKGLLSLTLQQGTMSTLDPNTGTQHTQYIVVVNWGPNAEYSEHWNVAIRWHELKELHTSLRASMGGAWPELPAVSSLGTSKEQRVTQRIEKLALYFDAGLDALDTNAALLEHVGPLVELLELKAKVLEIKKNYLILQESHSGGSNTVQPMSSDELHGTGELIKALWKMLRQCRADVRDDENIQVQQSAARRPALLAALGIATPHCRTPRDTRARTYVCTHLPPPLPPCRPSSGMPSS